MFTRSLLSKTLAVVATVSAGAIVVPQSQAKEKGTMVVQAVCSAVPVKVDGVLDDAVWKNAPVYSLTRSTLDLKNKYLPALQQGGTVRFAWDDHFFYMAVDFQDNDIVARGKADNEYLFANSDVAELFLKPVDKPSYWELYVTPAALKTSLFIQSRGYMGLPKCPDPTPTGIQVGARVQGTLNDATDTDKGWTAEMAFPRSDLERTGAKFGPGERWTIFTGRYNYAIGLDDGPELSMFPKLPATNYHLTRFYGILELLPAQGK